MPVITWHPPESAGYLMLEDYDTQTQVDFSTNGDDNTVALTRNLTYHYRYAHIALTNLPIPVGARFNSVTFTHGFSGSFDYIQPLYWYMGSVNNRPTSLTAKTTIGYSIVSSFSNSYSSNKDVHSLDVTNMFNATTNIPLDKRFFAVSAQGNNAYPQMSWLGWPTTDIERPRFIIDYSLVPEIDVNIGGTWKPIVDAKANIGGTWKTITDAWTNVGGVWKKS